MTKKEIRELEKGIVEINPTKYMIATTAHHILGSLSRPYDANHPEDNLCDISGETGDYYVGMWVTGIGFFNVLFPKATTRELTPDELAKCNSMKFGINNQPSFKLNIKEKKDDTRTRNEQHIS